MGKSREQDKCERQSKELLSEEEKLRQAFYEMHSCMKHQLWEHLGLTKEWNAYTESRKQESFDSYLPIF